MAPEDGLDDGEANQKTVFVDTTLDTHIATVVSDSDTVSDLKKKLISEHRQCFPAIGDIEIHCLKVKRRGNYYHLSDSMLVKSAWGSSKKVWFLSADACCVQQCDETRHSDRHMAGDQQALPWVTDCRSTDGHESPSGRPLAPSFVHGSPSMQPKMVPFANQKISCHQFTFGDSCKDISKNIEEDRSSNEDHCRNLEPASGQQLDSKVEKRMHTVNKEINSKKRLGDVRDESLLEDAFGPGPSVKRKRKTQRTESNVKASEEDMVLTRDTDKVKNKGTNINDENSIGHKPKNKDATLDGVVPNALSDEHAENTVICENMLNRVKEGENCCASDPVAAVVSSTVEDFGEKTHPQENTEATEAMPDVAVAMENNIQLEMPFGMSQKEKENELAQDKVIGKIPSSLTRTSDCDQDAPGVTAVGPQKGVKRSTKQKTAEKEASSTVFFQELHKAQDLVSHGQEFTGDPISKCKEDGVTVSSLKQGPKVKLPGRSKETTVCETTGASKGKRKKSKKSTAENEHKLLVKHVDNLVDDIPITISSPPFDEKKVNEGAEKETSFKPNKDAVDQVQQDLGSRGQEFTGDQLDKCKEDGAGKRKKKKSKKSTAENKDKLLVKHVDNRVGDITITVPSPCNVEKNFDEGKNEVLVKTVAENSLPRTSEKGDDPVVKDAEPIENNRIRVQVEDVVEKASKERKKKSGSRNDKSVVRHANQETLLLHSEYKERLEQKDGLHVDHGRNDDTLVENAIEIPRIDENNSQVNAEGINYVSEKQNEKRVGTKKGKMKKKNKKAFVGSENANEGDIPKEVGVNIGGGKPKGKDEQSFDDGLVRKAKNHKVSVRGLSDLPSKHQSAEVESGVEPEKTEENPKSVAEVSKDNMKGKDDVNNEVDTPKDGSHEIKTLKKSAANVNCSQNEKSLLNAPGTIFGEDRDSDKSSADDNAAANSDFSTSGKSSTSSSGETFSIVSRRNSN